MIEKSWRTGPETVATSMSATKAKIAPTTARTSRYGKRDCPTRSQRMTANVAQSVAATSRANASTKNAISGRYSSSGQPAISPIAALLRTRSPSVAHFMRVGLIPMPTLSNTISLPSFATSSSFMPLTSSVNMEADA